MDPVTKEAIYRLWEEKWERYLPFKEFLDLVTHEPKALKKWRILLKIIPWAGLIGSGLMLRFVQDPVLCWVAYGLTWVVTAFAHEFIRHRMDKIENDHFIEKLKDRDELPPTN